MYKEIAYQAAETALSIIKSGDRVYVHGSAMTPNFLLSELAKQAPRLQNVELTFISVLGDIVVDRPEYENNFHINCLFVSDSVRQSVNEGRAPSFREPHRASSAGNRGSHPGKCKQPRL